MEHTQSQIADEVRRIYSHLDDTTEVEPSLSHPLTSEKVQANGLTYTQLSEQLKKAETALRESQERLQLVMQGSRDGFWDWNILTNECYVSDRWKELRGYATDEQIEDPISVWSNGIHPDDRDRVIRAFYAHLEQKSALFNEEYRIQRKDKTYIWVLDRGQAVWNESGQATRIAGSQTDITYLKNSEEAVRYSELVYRMLADTMPQMFWITRPDGYHEYYNQRWYNYTGTQPGQTDGEEWQHLLHPDDVEKTAEVWQESLQTGKPYDIEYRFRRASDGEYRWHIGRALPLRDENGQVLKWFGSCTDIHDQKLAIEERAEALERERAARMEQEKANRIKDEFLAVLSHELRSPLNPILGWIRLLRTRKLDGERFDQALETIERNAKLQAQLIEDLLDVSRILRGKLTLTFAPVNLATAIEAAIDTVRLPAQTKQIQIQKHFPLIPIKVSGDFNRIQQVIWNLLSNALKFTPEGGQISVDLITDLTTDQTDSNSDHSYVAKIIVRDNGKGIAPDFLPHVFDQFRQADSSTTRQFGGLGLGLSIVRHIVQMHNGTIMVDSAGENQGSAFTVALPLSQSAASSASSASSSPVPHYPLSNLKILVVDDEADSRQLLSFLLEQYGATVTSAESAQEALDQIAQSGPDVLVSDLGMPEMDGYALIRKLRAEGRTMRAIAVTGYARDEDREAALQAGFQAHVTKPIEPTELVKTIVAIVNK
jgi:PAS domain S-box-containing protein